MRFLRALGLLLLFCVPALPAAGADVEVDVELVLAVDVSRSMTLREIEIQRRGYAEALVSVPVVNAIGSGPLGRIALTYVEWGGVHWQRTVVGWTAVGSRAEIEAFASKLTTLLDGTFRRTSISGILDHAAASIEKNGYTALRKIIDVSGDGPNNQGRPVLSARKDVLSRGITVNGLPLMTREGLGSQFHLDDLDEYYRNCVTGGPASFVIPVRTWDEFPGAVRKKLVLELAGQSPAPIKAAAFKAAASSSYDCLIGEKIWEIFIRQYRLDNYSP